MLWIGREYWPASLGQWTRNFLFEMNLLLPKLRLGGCPRIEAVARESPFELAFSII